MRRFSAFEPTLLGTASQMVICMQVDFNGLLMVFREMFTERVVPKREFSPI
jgi:hypothetical protein